MISTNSFERTIRERWRPRALPRTAKAPASGSGSSEQKTVQLSHNLSTPFAKLETTIMRHQNAHGTLALPLIAARAPQAGKTDEQLAHSHTAADTI